MYKKCVEYCISPVLLISVYILLIQRTLDNSLLIVIGIYLTVNEHK